MNSKPPDLLRILIVDDSEVVRMGLRALLGADRTLTVVDEAHDVSSGVKSAGKYHPDVVLLDIRLPDGTGFDACRQILECSPKTRVLVLTSVADEDVVDNAIRAGAHGYLLKEVHGGALVQAIHDVAAGKSILDPCLHSCAPPPRPRVMRSRFFLHRNGACSPSSPRAKPTTRSAMTSN